MTPEDILKFDKQYVWHPYSAANSDLPIFPVKRAEGVKIELYNGKKLIDGMASWWSAIHGYNHPELNKAIELQMENMAHVMFGGLTHEPAVKLAKTLVEITPPNLDKVFISDSGSVAVEVAMKMAIQYWQSQGIDKKHKFLSLKRGYHGDTFAAMSVCDPVTGMHHIFSNVLTQQVFTESPRCDFHAPWNDEYIADFEKNIKNHHESLAAVILEPIVQGTGGMKTYSPEFLKRVRALCDQYQALLIADEIATGFGRTGKMFACDHANISPDIMCLGKALTGGYLSLAATLCSSNIANTISAGESGVFMHGPTFMGNPLACALANKSIDLLQASSWQQKITRIEELFNRQLPKFLELPQVAEVRCIGAIGVIELHDPVNMKKILPMFIDHNIWLRPFGKLVYTLPPYIITDDELTQLLDATFDVVKQI